MTHDRLFIADLGSEPALGRHLRRLALTAAVLAGSSAAFAQPPSPQPTVTFESMVTDLGNDNPEVRLRAVQALRQAAFPESAVPLTRSLADSDDRVQLEAIAAELNIWLADRVVPRKRVGLVVEVRNRIAAKPIFEQGPNALDPSPVPAAVLTALRTASHDDNPRVAIEAMYAFGALSDNAYGRDRTALLAASASELAASLGVPQGDLRSAAILVIIRLYGWRMGDAAVEPVIGDAVVTALNDRDFSIRTAAMQALGALRYDRGVQALTDIYQHFQRGTNAVAALTALARIAHPSSLPLFVAALGGRDSMLKLPAVEGLARSGASDQATAIASALSTERNQELLLAGNFAGVLLSNGSLNELVESLTRSRLRSRGLVYLIDVAPGRARGISPHLSDPAPGLRADLLLVLGLSGDPDAPSIVQPLTQDPDPAAARAAARAVARLAGTSARP